MREIVVALAGNPNAGKTTIFNALTGARQHVGNYPGVTVEKKEGFVDQDGVRFRIVDLPGTYSLSAASPEEVVARDYLVGAKPDVVLQVVDASNLERNLFLTTQLMELRVKLVIALNMIDVAKGRGLEFDLEAMSRHLRSPVTPTVGNKRQGIRDLLHTIMHVVDRPAPDYEPISYSKDLTAAVERIDGMFQGGDRSHADAYPPRWLAARVFENDADITGRIVDKPLIAEVAAMRAAFERINDDPPEIRAAESKYGWISGLAAETVRLTPQAQGDASDRIDAVVLHRVLGLPIFLILMYGMFALVFTLAEPPMEWIQSGFAHLGGRVAGMWPRSAESPLRDLLVDGIIGGVGGVLVFLPNIILLFLVIAFLEGTGYMARAAFVMDSLMSKIGLHGKSFIPMLLGFGCTVPAIMATRTLENRRDRLTTILVLPFMSCGARLPIYALIIPAFFPERTRAWVLWLVYVIGIVFAIAGAKLLRSTVFRGEVASFVMELPPYRMPTFRSVVLLMWERAWEYCKKAGTIILGVSILLWAMTAYPKVETFNRDYEAEAAAARHKFVAGVRELGGTLALGSDGSLLARWAENEEDWRRAAREYWAGEPEYAAAVKMHAEQGAALYAEGAGGERLRAFAAAVESVPGGPVADGALRRGAIAYRDGLEAGYRQALEALDNARNGERLEHSVSGRVGKFFEPVLRPLGFDWRIGTAIIGSFAAKEMFVAQLGIVYSVGEADEDSEGLREKLRENYTPLQAFCMMLFCLLSVPCVATIAVTRREAGGWRYALAMLGTYTVVAYVTTLIVYQVGSMLG